MKASNEQKETSSSKEESEGVAVLEGPWFDDESLEIGGVIFIESEIIDA